MITNKDDLTKENARTKQLLKENGYEESIISRIFKRIAEITACPSHNNKGKPQISKKKRLE